MLEHAASNLPEPPFDGYVGSGRSLGVQIVYSSVVDVMNPDVTEKITSGFVVTDSGDEIVL